MSTQCNKKVTQAPEPALAHGTKNINVRVGSGLNMLFFVRSQLAKLHPSDFNGRRSHPAGDGQGSIPGDRAMEHIARRLQK